MQAHQSSAPLRITFAGIEAIELLQTNYATDFVTDRRSEWVELAFLVHEAMLDSTATMILCRSSEVARSAASTGRPLVSQGRRRPSRALGAYGPLLRRVGTIQTGMRGRDSTGSTAATDQSLWQSPLLRRGRE
ncbi:hypothetical protein M728_005402 (plasmid) [Ensifer sp. WSM1721]